MMNLDEINGEIAKLEQQPATYASMEKLSCLYVVRDHLTASPAGAEIPRGASDFMQACAGKTIKGVMQVMDDLMDALMILQPRLYDAVMEKLR